MRSLAILVKMQLKEQLNFKRFEVENVKLFHIILSALGAVLKFVMVTAMCYLFLFVSKELALFTGSKLSPVPATVIGFVLFVMLLMSIVSCTVGLTKSMYYARDNAVLLTLPCPSIQVYLSKLIIFFLFEVKRNFSFLVPLFLSYYILEGYAFYYYPWMLFGMLIVSLFTVSIGSIFSIPAMWIANFFRQHRWLQISTLVAAVSVAVVALFYGISLIPADIDLMANWTTTLNEHIRPFFVSFGEKMLVPYEFARMFLGEYNATLFQLVFPLGRMLIKLLILIGSTAVFLGLGLLIVRPLFYKMASTPFEYLKKAVKPKKNRAHSSLVSSIQTNFLSTIKDTNTIFGNVGILISVPMLVFLLNKIFLAMKTRAMGDHMIVAFNLMIMLLVVLNANCSIASIFSRDGRSSYLIKTLPTGYVLPIVTKFLPTATFGFLAVAATAPVLVLTLPLTIYEIVLMVVGVELIYLSHVLYSAQLDLMNPQNELYASVGSSESNPNETKSTLFAFLVAFLTAGVVFLLLNEGEGQVYEKLILVAAGVFAYRVWMFLSMLKLYYKEK